MNPQPLETSAESYAANFLASFLVHIAYVSLRALFHAGEHFSASELEPLVAVLQFYVAFLAHIMSIGASPKLRVAM